MNKHALAWVISITGISLVGLVIFQVAWVGNLIRANESAFKRDVQETLYSVAEMLEKKEALAVTVDNFHSEFIYKILSSTDSNRVELIESTFEKKVIEIQDYVQNAGETPDWVSFYFNSEKGDDSVQDFSVSLKDQSGSRPGEVQLSQEVDSMQARQSTFERQVKKVAKKSEYVQMAMHELFSGKKSLSDRVDIGEIDSLITVGLADRGIDLAYEFLVFDPINEVVVGQNFGGSALTLITSDLKANLFPGDVLGNAGFVSIRFPDQATYLFGKIWVTLFSSVLFILILLGTFSYTIRTIFKQKKLSEIKNDFINNMTHEFKTPISTVALACEALQDKDIISTEELKKKYLGIIDVENKRLGQQVEKVLQVALVDRKDFKLKYEELDVHEIIDQAIENIAIQVNKRGGHVNKELNAVHHLAKADRLHLTNIIYNLLDNANKYSGDSPKITIASQDKSDGIEISVQDEGIGMARDTLGKIFDKFYRIPTGNLHDVKGFGLGLAYVKNMIEAHGGTISASSELKKGSKFTVKLPYEPVTPVT